MFDVFKIACEQAVFDQREVKSDVIQKFNPSASMSLVRKRDGTMEPFNVTKIIERMDFIFSKIDLIRNSASDNQVAQSRSSKNLDKFPIIKKVMDSFTHGMSTAAIDSIIIDTALSKISEQPEWDIFAGVLKLDNEEKKISHINYTDRVMMMYHGTWPYIFEDYDLTKEMRQNQIDINPQTEALGSETRVEILSTLFQVTKSVEKVYSIGCSKEHAYNPETDGPVLHEISPVVYSNTLNDKDHLIETDWSCIPSTKCKFLKDGLKLSGINTPDSVTNEKVYHTLFGSNRSSDLRNILIDRSDYIIKIGGVDEYDRRLCNYSFVYDKKGRIVQLHSIVSKDYYRFICCKKQEIQTLVDEIHKQMYVFMHYSNSTFQAVTGKLEYCLRTPVTKKNLELPHESIVRIAIGEVIGQLYDDKPEYVSYCDKGKQKKSLMFEKFTTRDWDCILHKISLLVAVALNDFVSLPTPTRKNIGTKNSQGTSCITMTNYEDSIYGIFNTIEAKELFSRGGSGTSLDNSLLRSDGALIKKTNGTCSGTIPINKITAQTSDYVNQAGNRGGANATYYPWYHPDFKTALLHKSVKQKNLDKNSEAKQIFYAVCVDDIFMERVKNNDNVSLFCPSDARLLSYISNRQEYRRVYELLEKTGRAREVVNAKAYFLQIANVALNGDPYCLAMDTANKLSMLVPRTIDGDLMKTEDLCGSGSGYDPKYLDYGQPQVIRQSNLCCEVVQPTTPIFANGKISPVVSACNLCCVTTPRCCVSGKNVHRYSGFMLVISYIKNELKTVIPSLYGEDVIKFYDEQFNSIIDSNILKPIQELSKIDSPTKNDVKRLFTKSPERWFALIDTICDNLEYHFQNTANFTDMRIYYKVNLRNKIGQKIEACILFLYLIQRIIITYVNYQIKNDYNDGMDHSKLFMAGFYSAIFADGFIGYTFNLPKDVHWYQKMYRSLIVGVSGVADSRINSGISYWDLEKSLVFERDIMESVQFGAQIASLFSRIFHQAYAYPKFLEGALQKGFFHHELFGKYYGVVKQDTKIVTDKHINASKYPAYAQLFSCTPKSAYEFQNLNLDSNAVLYESMFDTKEYPKGYKTPINGMTIESGRWNWHITKGMVMCYGEKNSTKTGNMPTSSSSVCVGATASFKPISGIHSVNSGNSANTIETCWPAVNYLAERNLWNSALKNHLASHAGSVLDFDDIDLVHKRVLSTAFEIEPQILILHDVVRGAFTCQSQSSNRYLNSKYVNAQNVVDMWLYAYERGIITLSYYINADTVVKTTNNSSLGGRINNVGGIDISQRNQQTFMSRSNATISQSQEKDKKMDTAITSHLLNKNDVLHYGSVTEQKDYEKVNSSKNETGLPFSLRELADDLTDESFWDE